MYIHTHGIKGDPVIILLHPMGITGEKMYEVVGSKFGGKYYFITPDMGGHGSEKRSFRSAKAEASALHNYLQRKGLTQIRLLYGLRMRPVSRRHSRRGLVGGSTFRRTPISRSPLDKNPMPGNLSELQPVNAVNTKGQFFRASFGKNPRFQMQLDKRAGGRSGFYCGSKFVFGRRYVKRFCCRTACAVGYF